ncbi:transposon TX1 [Tanacetum coccineum]
MGRLWMIFKKYGTGFDMFMVQKRLRNGQKYGFVRLKNIRDTDGFLDQLRKIKLGEEWMKVYVAYDRRGVGRNGKGAGDGGLVSSEVNRKGGERREVGSIVLDEKDGNCGMLKRSVVGEGFHQLERSKFNHAEYEDIGNKENEDKDGMQVDEENGEDAEDSCSENDASSDEHGEEGYKHTPVIVSGCHSRMRDEGTSFSVNKGAPDMQQMGGEDTVGCLNGEETLPRRIHTILDKTHKLWANNNNDN